MLAADVACALALALVVGLLARFARDRPAGLGPPTTNARRAASGPRRRLRPSAAALAAVAASAAAVALTAAVLRTPVLAAAAGVGVGAMVVVGVRARRARARRSRRMALLEAIELLVQLLPTGQGVRQALEVLADRGPLALRSEVGRLVERSRVVPFETAVREAEVRLDESLASLLAVALIVGNRSGGQLVPLFQELGRAARANELVRGQVEAEQAQGRYGAAVICCMPVVVLVTLRWLNPGYLAPYATADGQVVLGGSLVVMALGYAWMRRILHLPDPDRLPLRTGRVSRSLHDPRRPPVDPTGPTAGLWPRPPARPAWAWVVGRIGPDDGRRPAAGSLPVGARPSRGRRPRASAAPAPIDGQATGVPLPRQRSASRGACAALPPPPPPPRREEDP